MKKSLAFAASLLALAAPAAAHEDHGCIDDACSFESLFQAGQAGGGKAAVDPTAAIHYGKWGIDLAGMDRSVRPADATIADAATDSARSLSKAGSLRSPGRASKVACCSSSS